MRAFLVVFVLMILAAVFLQRPPPGLVMPQTAEIDAATAALSAVQSLSFDEDREYCGYLGRDGQGRYVATPLRPGARDGCTPQEPPRGFRAIASLHTHGAYAPDVPAEFPTAQDIESDAAEGVNGYVATPGGRLWFLDSAAAIAVQICGPECLPQDPGFRAGDDGWIALEYTLDDLRWMEGSH